MEDARYRLVFRGEVLEGQHIAVVMKRIAGLLKLDTAKVERLFNGEPTVLAKSSDARNAARYQKAFKEAGARLRVVPLASTDGPRWELAPVGALLLEKTERKEEVFELPDISHLSLAEIGVLLSDPSGTEVSVPVVDFTIADVGVQLSDADDREEAVPVAPGDFGLAEAGTPLGVDPVEPPPVPLVDPDFEIAEVGVTLGTPRPAAPQAPSTDHIQLEAV